MIKVKNLQSKGLLDPVIEEALGLLENCGNATEIAELHAVCSDVMFRKGQYNDAVYHGEQSIEADEAFGPGHMHLGWALYWLGLNERARTHLAKAVELNPDEAEASYRLGSLLANALGRPDEAEECFSKCVELDPKRALAWQQRGLVRWNRGDSRGAEEDYRRGARAGDAWCGYILEYNGFPLETAEEVMALADDCWLQNQRDRSVELMRDALNRGFGSPEKTLEAQLKLADSLSAMKLSEQALDE